MKNLLVGYVLLALTVSISQAQNKNCDTNAINEQLLDIEEDDQKIRKKLMPVLGRYQEDGSGMLKFLFLAWKMNRQDERNQRRVTKMFDECGWKEDLNAASHSTLFLVLQHSPDSMMRRYYPTVQEYSEKGLLEPDAPATMFDRLQMNAGLAQRFGTQTFVDDQNRNLLWPVENQDSLSVWRSQVGLPSMETYFKMAKDSLGIEMTWDRELTLEKAVQMKES